MIPETVALATFPDVELLPVMHYCRLCRRTVGGAKANLYATAWEARHQVEYPSRDYSTLCEGCQP